MRLRLAGLISVPVGGREDMRRAGVGPGDADRAGRRRAQHEAGEILPDLEVGPAGFMKQEAECLVVAARPEQLKVLLGLEADVGDQFGAGAHFFEHVQMGDAVHGLEKHGPRIAATVHGQQPAAVFLQGNGFFVLIFEGELRDELHRPRGEMAPKLLRGRGGVFEQIMPQRRLQPGGIFLPRSTVLRISPACLWSDGPGEVQLREAHHIGRMDGHRGKTVLEHLAVVASDDKIECLLQSAALGGGTNRREIGHNAPAHGLERPQTPFRISGSAGRLPGSGGGPLNHRRGPYRAKDRRGVNPGMGSCYKALHTRFIPPRVLRIGSIYAFRSGGLFFTSEGVARAVLNLWCLPPFMEDESRDINYLDLLILRKIDAEATVEKFGGYINTSFFETANLLGTMKLKGLVDIESSIGGRSPLIITGEGRDTLARASQKAGEPLDTLDHAILHALAGGARALSDLQVAINIRPKDLAFHLYKLKSGDYIDDEVHSAHVGFSLTEKGFNLVGVAAPSAPVLAAPPGAKPAVTAVGSPASLARRPLPARGNLDAEISDILNFSGWKTSGASKTASGMAGLRPSGPAAAAPSSAKGLAIGLGALQAGGSPAPVIAQSASAPAQMDRGAMLFSKLEFYAREYGLFIALFLMLFGLVAYAILYGIIPRWGGL